MTLLVLRNHRLFSLTLPALTLLAGVALSPAACVAPEDVPRTAPHDANDDDRSRGDADADSDRPKLPRDPISDEVKAYEREAGVTFENCGIVQNERWSGRCVEATADGLACLRRALDRCQPAKLRYSYSTIEGGPIYHDYFVSPECALVLFYDTRFDDFGEKGVLQRQCESLPEPKIDEDGSCSPLRPSDCVDQLVRTHQRLEFARDGVRVDGPAGGVDRRHAADQGGDGRG